jgi:hypothetical protein
VLQRLLLLGLLTAGFAFAGAATARTPKPVLEAAQAGTQCVAPPAVMRRDHMEFLKHQRDDTVHGGIRGAKFSLKGCIDCHANPKTQSVAKDESNFCVSCHVYVAVKIDCFGCHTPKARPLAQGGTK